MGDLRPENGGGLPPDDGGSQPNGLPDIPPEWGPVVIPDDPGALADEAASVRRELTRERRHNRIRRLFGLAPVKLTTGEPTQSLTVPLFIMFTAVVITLVSLFVVTWNRTPGGQPDPDPPPATIAGITDVVLTDAAGRRVELGSLVPAVVLVVDDCACPQLVDQTATSVGTDVTVVAVGRTAPRITDPTRVLALADPDGRLAARFTPPIPQQAGTATAILVNEAGTTVAVLAGVRNIDAIRPSLPALAPTTASPK